MVKRGSPPPFAISPFADWSLIGRVGFGGFLLVLVLAPLIGGFPSGAAYQSDTALNALRGLVILASVCLLIAPPLPAPTEAAAPVPLQKLASGAVWAAFGWTCLSLLVHSHGLTSQVYLFAMLPATLDFLVYALLFWAASRLVHREFLPYIAVAVAASAGIAALMLVREYGQFTQMNMKEQRAQSPFFSPNFAAGFFALALPVVVAYFVAQKERLAVLGLGVVAALMIGALAATGSRAGIALAVVGVSAALVLYLASQKNAHRTFPWAKAVGLVVVFAVMAWGFRGPLTARVEGGIASSQEHSGDFRKETARASLVMARANPVFGTGPGTFPYRFAPYARTARTDLAHNSFIQIAAEQGFPALLFSCAALMCAFLCGVRALVAFRKSEAETDVLPRLLLCGIIGGTLAGAARSLFDSEWSLLGNGIPFWGFAGLLVGFASFAAAPKTEKSAAKEAPAYAAPVRYGFAALLIVPLVLCVMLAQTAGLRDSLTANRRNGTPSDIPASWPPDPQLLYLSGKLDDAARVEPSGKRWYQLGLAALRQNDFARAAEFFQKSTNADPTNLQTWRRLAEARQSEGDLAGAQAAWQELITRYEGPIGQIRAIPELTDLYPAFAYFALGEAAQNAGKTNAARPLYERAANVIERYSRTTPTYQQVETQSAYTSGIDLEQRRREARDLYEQIVAYLTEITTGAADKAALDSRKTETLTRFDALMKPVGSDAPGTTE